MATIRGAKHVPGRLAVSAATGLLVLLGCATAPTATVEDRAALAPTGTLRVGLYTGSPSSVVVDPVTGASRGLGYDLGRALAARLGVPFTPVVFQNNARVLAAVKDAEVDVVFTNASPVRARDMDFTVPYLDVEKSFLVPANAAATSIADMRRARLRIGVSEGSTTASELLAGFPEAVMIATPTVKAAIEMLADGRLDAFATNDAILFEMSDSLPGSRVLEGRWGLEHFAAGIPKGRADRTFVDAFIVDAKRDGTIERAVRRAGLRGGVAATER